MTEERMTVNSIGMSQRSKFFRRNSGGSLFDLVDANVPLSNPPASHRLIRSNPESVFARANLMPDKVFFFNHVPPTKVIASSRNPPIELTLEAINRDHDLQESSRNHPDELTMEEIFRDHDLKKSSDSLEISMHENMEESNSDLSGIFEDEDRQAPLTTARGAPLIPMRSSFSSIDTIDTTDDGTQRLTPSHEDKWNTRLKELVQYREEHGDCLVPHSFKSNPQLARWVKRQRRQYKLAIEGRASTMSQGRLATLNEIGFVWSSQEAAWQDKLNDLYRYSTVSGNCNVIANYKVNPQLAAWVKCQRRQYKLHRMERPSAMTPDRIIRLEKIGFEWEIRSFG